MTAMDFETTDTYCGRWKLDGYASNHKHFREGCFDLQCNRSNTWRVQLRLNCDLKRVVLSYHLTGRIKNIIHGRRIILEMICGNNIHFETNDNRQPDLLRQLKAIEDKTIICAPMTLNQVRTPAKQSATSAAKSTPLSEGMSTSPIQFTGVKERSNSPEMDIELCHACSSPRDIIKNNASQNYLSNGQQKSRESLENINAGSFYGKAITQSTYSMSYPLARSLPSRKPGLLPDPSPRNRLSGLSPTFSWLQRTPSSGKTTSKNLQGFSNLGNTCYMNAILQAIFGLDMFTSDLVEADDRTSKLLEGDHKNCLLHCLYNLFMSKKSNSTTEQRRQLLADIKKNISSSAKRFSGFEQHDAHEFLGQVLDQLKEELEKINKQIAIKSDTIKTNNDILELQDMNPSASNFEFKITHTITCTECGADVKNLETFNDMSVDIPPTRALESTWSIQDALDLTFLPEEVDYKCEKCGGKEATVNHKFSKLPRVLIVHLKRYSYNTVTSRNTKLGQSLIIPRYLTLKSQCTEQTTPPLPAPEAADVLLKTARFNFIHMNKSKSGNNTPKRRLNLDGNDSNEPGRDTSLRKAVENSNRNNTGARRVLRTDDVEDNTMETSEPVHPPIALPSPTVAFSKESYIPDATMTEDDMIHMALERSMQEVITPQKQVNFTLDEPTDCSPIRKTPLKGGKDSNSEDMLVDLDTELPDLESSQSVQVNLDHTYTVADENCSSSNRPPTPGPPSARRGLHLEPPFKRSKVDECDSAYNSFTEIEDRSSARRETSPNIVKSTQTSNVDLNSSGVDLNLSDEENKENYTPPAAQSPEHQGEPAEQKDAATDTVKLVPEEGYDEEAQLRLAIENSLKDLESMDIQQDLDDDLEKAKQLSLKDAEYGEPYLLTPQRPKDKRDLKRTAAEETALVEHAEKGDLPFSYQLVSIVSHIGQTSVSGHYICDTYDMNERRWYSWNDSHGQSIAWDEIRRERERTGYIFFYVAKEAVEDMEAQYYRKRTRVRSLSVGELPMTKKIAEVSEKPNNMLKVGFMNKHMELR